jgi:molecular chaperone GrpE (heat shock protein)
VGSDLAEQVAAATAAALEAPLQELAGRLARLEVALSPQPVHGGADSSLSRVWAAAGLLPRLRFARSVLPAGHPRLAGLTEVESLVELCEDVGALEAWLVSYPSAFAEAGISLERVPQPDTADDGDLLACEVLATVRDAVSRCLGTLGVTWVAPRPGDEIPQEAEVLGEEPDEAVPPGRVKRLGRPGFRRRGRLELPAQVIRAVRAERSAELSPQPPTPVARPEAGAASLLAAEPAPDWLRALQRLGGAPAGIMEALEALAAAAAGTARDSLVTRALEPLVGLLATGWAGEELQASAAWANAAIAVRIPLLEWLRQREQVELILPGEHSMVDPSRMEVVGERRTAHAHERGRVARVQRAGLERGGRVLVPARVIRYEPGGSA